MTCDIQKPCPCCNEAAALMVRPVGRPFDKFQAICQKCGLGAPSGVGITGAIDNWNALAAKVLDGERLAEERAAADEMARVLDHAGRRLAFHNATTNNKLITAINDALAAYKSARKEM
jgi:hypothetical protein